VFTPVFAAFLASQRKFPELAIPSPAPLPFPVHQVAVNSLRLTKKTTKNKGTLK
jgi:hypothetical protein